MAVTHSEQSPQEFLTSLSRDILDSEYKLPPIILAELCERARSLLDNDPMLVAHLERYYQVPGSGMQTEILDEFANLKKLYAELATTIVRILPEGARRMLPQVEDIDISGAISWICGAIYKTEVCCRLGRCMMLSEEFFQTTERWLNDLGLKIGYACKNIANAIELYDASSEVPLILRRLLDVPKIIFENTSMRFYANKDSVLQSGDRLYEHPTILIVSLLPGGYIHGVVKIGDSDGYEEFLLPQSNIQVEGRIIERRGSMLFGFREASHGIHPFREGVTVQRPGSGGFRNISSECGTIIKAEGNFNYRVAWLLKDGSARIESNTEEQLRFLSFRSIATRREYPKIKTVLKSIVSSLTSTNARAELSAFLQPAPSKPAELDARQLTQMCRDVLASEYPIAFHVLGDGFMEEDTRQVINDFKERVATNSNATPSLGEGELLRTHFCTPIILVVASDLNSDLYDHLQELHDEGWKVILLSREDYGDHLVQSMIADTEELPAEKRFYVARSSGALGYLLHEVIGQSSKAHLSSRIQQRPGPNILSFDARRDILSALDTIAEIDDGRPVITDPKMLAGLARVIQKSEDPNGLRPAIQEELGVEAYSAPTQGITESPSSWSRRSLIELSLALAKSRLSPDHPAVLLRGITCLDLSPAALAQFLESGAHFFRIRGEDNTIAALVISLPPPTVEETRPELSETLGHRGSTGYVYWLWIDPQGDDNLRALYAKMVNALIMDQLASGSTFVFGRILEANFRSMTTAVIQAGFDLVPLSATVAGQPAIGIGIDLSSLISMSDTGIQPQRMMRSDVVREALAIFVNGLSQSDTGAHQIAQYPPSERLNRVVKALDFLRAAYIFRQTSEELLDLGTLSIRWEDRMKLIERVKEYHLVITPFLTEAQNEDIRRLLKRLEDECKLEDSLREFDALLREVIPESITLIKDTYRRLIQQCSESVAPRYAKLPEPNPIPELRNKGIPTVPFPELDYEEVRLNFHVLPQKMKTRLRDWFNSNSHLTPNLLSTGSLYYNPYVESFIAESNAAGEEYIPANSFRRYLEEDNTTDEVKEHITLFLNLIAWVNDNARQGTLKGAEFNKYWRAMKAILGE